MIEIDSAPRSFENADTATKTGSFKLHETSWNFMAFHGHEVWLKLHGAGRRGNVACTSKKCNFHDEIVHEVWLENHETSWNFMVAPFLGFPWFLFFSTLKRFLLLPR